MMFRWFLMLKKWFATRAYRRSVERPSLRCPRERAQARRPRATVKPQLDGLSERILPSATVVNPLTEGMAAAPQAATSSPAVYSYAEPTLEQWGHWYAGFQQGLSSFVTMADQKAAQVESHGKRTSMAW